MLKNVSYEYEKEVRALLHADIGQEMNIQGVDLELDAAGFIDEIVANPFVITGSLTP